MKPLLISIVGLSLLLGGCAAAEPTISQHKTDQIAAENRRQSQAAQDKAQDTSAAKKSGQQYQADNDHITSATNAAAAVKQVLNDPKQQLIHAVPTINQDGRGRHYYQVDAYHQLSNGQRGHLLQSYFVYPDGRITTKQLTS
ncbi:hypothetical protein [Lactobacillus sp. CBA3605] [Lactiplantibacillus mudanjiangensis]|uniref:hypothetical protein n=1 Tax=Lactiplantibacillus mudanjiangensis TaxID=1296538 RepID=UPI001015B6D7|nr:hypothetical protein [Lactobacillus sp. CBA3605] [Lactiplantibacillus mudanjiangensis]